eukprot:NODE_854_length_3699_cov_0.222500.p4 type:complete len:112 gc:universal NODE_854_length_3699_cov_0.222500:2631-2296(-)
MSNPTVETVQISNPNGKLDNRNKENHHTLFYSILPAKKEDFELPFNIYKELYRKTESTTKRIGSGLRETFMYAAESKCAGSAGRCDCDENDGTTMTEAEPHKLKHPIFPRL